MLEPTVQAALVVILAWLLKKACEWLKIEIDETTLNTLAAALVVFFLSRLGVEAARVAGLL
jgi:hypothetical protein